MWPVPVVVLLACCDMGSCFGQRREQRFIEALVPEAAVEAFDKSILHWLAWLDVMPVDAGLLAPFENGHAGEFGSVVRNHGHRLAPHPDEGITFTSNRRPESDVSAISAGHSIL